MLHWDMDSSDRDTPGAAGIHCPDTGRSDISFWVEQYLESITPITARPDRQRSLPQGTDAAKTTKQFSQNVAFYEGVREMSKDKSVVATFDSHVHAEAAVKELQRAGFNMKKLSIVGKDYHTDEHVVGYYNAGDRMKYWGKLGAFSGGLWGLLFGSAFFWVPGIGPLLVAGPLATAIVGGLEGAAVVGGLSALGAGLYGLGIPKDSILKYETAIKSDKYLLIAHGTAEEVHKAEEILGTSEAKEVQAHGKVASHV